MYAGVFVHIEMIYLYMHADRQIKDITEDYFAFKSHEIRR